MNLVYTIEDERIHAFDWNRNAVPIKRDPLECEKKCWNIDATRLGFRAG